MNKENPLIIPGDLNQIEAVELIRVESEKSWDTLCIDLTAIGFDISRDFLLVLARRFRPDQIHLMMGRATEVSMATHLSLSSELRGVKGDYIRAAPIEKKNILAHNMTMWQYFVYEMRRVWAYIQFLALEKVFKNKKKELIYISKTSPNLIIMIFGLIVSVTLLLFIFHFAVSKTFVSIVPQVSVRPVNANIIYSSRPIGSGSLLEPRGRNVLTLRNMSLPIEKSMIFTLDTIDPNSATNAAGTITIYNELPTAQTLKPQTRFVTGSGIVYRAKNWVNVPASRSLNGITEIGSAEVDVVADTNDDAGGIIGIRGNIPGGTDLVIPGLRFNRDRVYAKAKGDFVGWADPRIHLVTEWEVRKFQWLLREQLSRAARSDLQARLDEEKKNGTDDYTLLSADTVTLTGETIVITSGQKYGDLANEITLRATSTVNALAYDRRATVAYLTDVFREWLLRGTDKELAIHPETLRVANLLSRAEDGQEIKATMEMTATISYDFENTTNELTRYMKALITGLSRKDATDKLINEWHVKSVDITFSPFWIRQVSSNIDNIEFVIKR
jgi:hypothetical protein